MKNWQRIILPLALILTLLLSSAVIVRSQEDDDQVVPLTITVYGEENAMGTLGVRVALEEMAELGPFEGADGQLYEFVYFQAESPTELPGAFAVIALPDRLPAEEALALDMPIMLLSPDEPLLLENIEAAVFRAMTNVDVLYETLAQFSVDFNSLQRITLVGNAEADSLIYDNFEAALQAEDDSEQLRVQRINQPQDGDLSAAQMDELMIFNPQVVAFRGDPIRLNTLLSSLAEREWAGAVVYQSAFEDSAFIEQVPGIQIIGMTSWVNSLEDQLSLAFINSFRQRTGKAPTAEAVSGYDITWALRLMVERVGPDPSDVVTSLPLTDLIRTTQGIIDPANFEGNNLFETVVIYELLPLGGADVLARYNAGEVVLDEDIIAQQPTPTPTETGTLAPPSATPSQPIIIVAVDTLNVRTGPGLNYDRITRINEGEQYVIVGTVPDFSWFLIQLSDGSTGWVAAEFVTVFTPSGNLADIPLAPIPPSPTPAPSATPSATPIVDTPPDLVVESVTLNPSPIVSGQPFIASVTVRNQGTNPAGAFAVAAAWRPGEVFTAETVNSLAAGQTQTVTLTATVAGPGSYEVAVIADLNEQIAEPNENNNLLSFRYAIDPVPPAVNSTNSFNAPATVLLAGANPDFDWNGTSFTAQPGTTFAVLGLPYQAVDLGSLSSTAINQPSVGQVQQDQVIGIRTGEGHCGVMHVRTLSGSQVSLEYRMFNPGDCPA